MPRDIEPDHVVLRHHADLLVLDPRHGGAVRGYRSRGHDVLRPARHVSADPFELASFPLVPYANRIAHGRFVAQGRAVHVARNWDGDPHPLHGQGWRSRWEVLQAGAAEAVLGFEGGGDDWPWRYRAEQRFHLGEEGLRMRLSVENLSGDPMPAMLGFHPYFPDAAHARLRARGPRVWLTDAGALPVVEVPTPAAWNFEEGQDLAAVQLDNCFVGWDGVAVLSWPGRTVTLRARGAGGLHVYVPPGGALFCVEPQSAATGALNRDEEEVPRLAPGEQLELEMSLSLGGP